MASEVSVTDAYVRFVRDRREARRRGCTMDYYVPMAKVARATLEPVSDGRLLLRVEVAGTQAQPPDRDPHVVPFDAAHVDGARAVTERINTHAAGEAADPHVAFVNSPGPTRTEERIYRMADLSWWGMLGCLGLTVVVILALIVVAMLIAF